MSVSTINASSLSYLLKKNPQVKSLVHNIIDKLGTKYNFDSNDAWQDLGLDKLFCNSSGRKDCENIYTELLFAKILKFPKIDKLPALLATKAESIGITNDQHHKYLIDLNKRSTKQQEEWFHNCRKEIAKWYNEEINSSIHDKVEVFLVGKHITNPQIIDLVKDYDKKQTKSDIYALVNGKTWYGFSIKTDTDCQLSNWSIEKIIKHNNDIITANKLRDIRLTMLKEHGIDRKTWNETDEKKQQSREIYNKLYYGENDYDKNLHEWMINNNNYFKKIIALAGGSSIDTFVTYKYDGKKLVDINMEYKTIVESDFELIPDTEKNKDLLESMHLHSWYSSTQSKTWYYITINDVPSYRFEIRMTKGSPWPSPQLYLYNI